MNLKRGKRAQPGLFWSPAKRRWVVRVKAGNERVDVGQFKTLDKARQAAAMAAVGDLDVARSLYEAEKAVNLAEEKEASKARLLARREEKIARDGHPYEMLYPHDEAKAGVVVTYKGQRFRCVAQRETVSARRGLPIVVDVWRSHCATCGVPYEFQLLPKRDGRPIPFWPVRRCETHKRPGTRIDSRKLHAHVAREP